VEKQFCSFSSVENERVGKKKGEVSGVGSAVYILAFAFGPVDRACGVPGRLFDSIVCVVIFSWIRA
jgi:hypothetical protein